jgi:lysozyme
MFDGLNVSLGARLFALSFAFLGGCAPAGEDVDEDTAEFEDAIRMCADGPTLKGIDVSHWQRAVRWSAVEAAGVGFAFARVSDGAKVLDGQFEANWAGMKRHGIVRGAYQYFRPAQSASAQADIMIDAIGRLDDDDLPAVIDVETADGQSSADVVRSMKIWLHAVEAATGKTPIIYAAMGFWDTLAGTSHFAGYPLWVAHYGPRCPSLPKTWGDWIFWQYSDAGSVAGVSGGVDTNLFNGTREDLLAFAGKRSAVAPLSIASIGPE